MKNLIICDYCNKKIMRAKGSINKTNFCNKLCMYKYNKKRFSGIHNPNFRHGKYCYTYYCECGKQLNSGKAKLCIKCSHKYMYSKKVRKKMRKNHADFSGNKNPMFGKVTHGKHTKYKNICMNSSWEADFAKWLILSRVKWEYEPKVFDLGSTTYRPDFYLPEFNCYIEIKGYWRGDAKRKFKKFRKLYPKIKIRILEREQLISMGVL